VGYWSASHHDDRSGREVTLMTEFTTTEIDAQHVELLPAKETLNFNFNWANVYASNSALAVNAATVLSQAHAQALQAVTVNQH
jgi:hypothetical protein